MFNQILAINDINLEFKHGEFVCIIGDVGSGKSSLLSSLIGDLLYLDPKFVMKYKDLPLNEEIILEVKKESQKLLSPGEAPIILSDEVAYV